MQALERIAVTDDDGQSWVRARTAMLALGVPRGAYVRWVETGQCVNVRRVRCDPQKGATKGVILLLRTDEVMAAYDQHRRRKRWTRADIEFVEDWYGRRTKKWIAKKLGRTERSVKSKALELGLSVMDADGMLCVREIADLLAVSVPCVQQWFARFYSELKARPKEVSVYRVTTAKKLIAFLDNHPRIARNIEPSRVEWVRFLATGKRDGHGQSN